MACDSLLSNDLRFCSRIKRKQRNDRPAPPMGEESGRRPGIEAKSYQYAACSNGAAGSTELLTTNHVTSARSENVTLRCSTLRPRLQISTCGPPQGRWSIAQRCDQSPRFQVDTHPLALLGRPNSLQRITLPQRAPKTSLSAAQL